MRPDVSPGRAVEGPGPAAVAGLFPPDSPLPVARAVRDRRAVYRAAEDMVEDVPDIPALRTPGTDFAAIPLMIDERCPGSIVLRVDRPRPPGSGWSPAPGAAAQER